MCEDQGMEAVCRAGSMLTEEVTSEASELKVCGHSGFSVI